MTSCLTSETLQAFLSGNLGQEELSTVELHLQTCHKCQDAASRASDDSEFRREFLDNYLLLRRPQHEVDSNANTRSLDDLSDATNSPSPDQPTHLGRYELRKRIGCGGIGEVWEAYDPVLKRLIAIKMVRGDRHAGGRFLGGFTSEGQKLASLRHEGIVDVYDFGEHCGQVYIVTELLSGGTLAERIVRSQISFIETARLISRVAKAVHAAHLAGLIHRDIKPANIVFDSSGNPRLADFGLAVSETDLRFQLPGIEGTLLYMSPEQTGLSIAQTGAPVRLGIESDIYSLGVVTYQLLTGDVPHRGASNAETLELIYSALPAPPHTINPSIPMELDAICLKCLCKQPEHRFESALQLAEALEAWLCSVPDDNQPQRPVVSGNGTVAHTGSTYRASQSSWIKWGVATFVTIGVVLTVLALLSNHNTDSERQEPEPRKDGTLSIRVVTNPPGARIVVYPTDKRFGLPDGSKRLEGGTFSPVTLDLEPGFYLVVAAFNDEQFHEVFRTAPESTDRAPQSFRHRMWFRKGEILEWPDIEIPMKRVTGGMGRFDGDATFAMGEIGNSQIPRHFRRVPSFLVDCREVTFADYRAAFDGALPTSLASLRGKMPPGNYPLAGIWWDEAVKFAEKVGKRLPTEAEYEFAATAGGHQRFPWGNSANQPEEWPLGPAGDPSFDMINSTVPVFGLFSNVAEWTSSFAVPYPQTGMPLIPENDLSHFIVRGAPASVITGKDIGQELAANPRNRVAIHNRNPGNPIGVRCVRSVRPRLLSSDLEIVLDEPKVTAQKHANE